MAKPSFLSAVARKYALLIFVTLLLHPLTSRSQNAAFSSDVTSGCFPLTVRFTDNSTGSITAWAWNFGNNNSSPLQNPSAVYSSPGIYAVSLTVSNNTTSKTETHYITVYDYPSVDFSFDHPNGCVP